MEGVKQRVAGLPTEEEYRAFKQGSELGDFVNNVLKQVDGKEYLPLYHEATQAPISEGIYQRLASGAEAIKGGRVGRVITQFNALKQERNTLSANLEKVLDPNRPIKDYAEVGMPGRMIHPLKSRMGVRGEITVINEQEDVKQSGFPRPYQKFIPLTYDPLPLAPESKGMISCFAGLHHCPPEKLQDFVRSIHQALKPGGLFLLREHDCRDPRMRQLAVVIHSVFNAVTGVDLSEEYEEVRNFKSLKEWIDLLEGAGFRCVSKPLIREGDSTDNALLKFIKVGHEEASLDVIREKLISRKSNYTRPLEQTHLTTLEWFNVESSQNLSSVNNCWDYPYLRDVGQLWKGFYHSWNAARHVANWTDVVTSEHTLMQTTILALMTTEYVAKGILSTPIWALSKLGALLPKAPRDRGWEVPANTYRSWLTRFGHSLEDTTFYAQRYLPFIKRYWTTFARAWTEARKSRSVIDLTFDRQTLKNVITGIAATVDMLFRAAIATPINWFYGGQQQGDDRDIGLIIKGPVTTLGAFGEVISEEGNPYKGLVLPRYGLLLYSIKKLALMGNEIVEIAGQKQVQVDLVVAKDFVPEEDFQVLYERAYLPDSRNKIIAVNIPVSHLNKDFFQGTSRYKVHRLYDF